MSTCRLGIGGCIYFRVYGKRLEQALTQHHRQHTPPFKEVGRRAAGVWLTTRRRGGKQTCQPSYSAEALGVAASSVPATARTHLYLRSPLPHLAEQRAAAGVGASLPVSPLPRSVLRTSQKLVAGRRGRSGGGYSGDCGYLDGPEFLLTQPRTGRQSCGRSVRRRLLAFRRGGNEGGGVYFWS